MGTGRNFQLLLGSALLALGTLALPAAEKPKPFQPVAQDMADKPLPQEIKGNVRFSGNTAFTEEQLREPLALSLKEIEEEGLTRPRADDAAYYLTIFYRKQGYPNAEIAWDIGGRTLALKIKEGPRAYLNKITFEGNKTQKTEDLYEYMIGETGERLLQQPVKFPFVEADMQTGVARLRGLYESVGRLDTQIADPVIEPLKDGVGRNVRVIIKEGPQYRFGKVTFVGQSEFSRERLLEALANPTGELPKDDETPVPNPLGEPFTVQGANTIQHNLLYFFKLQGYYAAKVEVSAKPAAAGPVKNGIRLVPVTFTMAPGPVYHFDGMKVTGLTRLHESFMQNRFRSLTGQVYNPTLLDERYREVLRTGLFKTLRLSTVPLPSEEVEVQLVADEAKAKEVGFSLGFSSFDGAMLGLRLADRNFMGRGRPLTLQLDYSTRTMKGELLYVDPWLFESQYALRSRIFLQSRLAVGYEKQEQGIRFELTRKPKPYYQVGIFLEGRNVNIPESEIKPIFLGPSSYQIVELGLTQQLDFRNNPVNPSKGWVIDLGTDVDAVAGEVAFARANARVSYYLPIKKKYLLSLGARAGIIYPVTEVPIDERFFNGGGTTVRSFREYRLGPTDGSGHPIGGEAYTVFNAEFLIPIKDALGVALFVDAGNVSSQLEDAGLEEMRYAVGVGLRYKLPVGPVRLDVGLNPNPKEDESIGAVSFSFGFAF